MNHAHLTIALFYVLSICSASEPLQVRAGGATYPQLVYEHWDSAYAAEYPEILVEYEAFGSGVARDKILEGTEVVFVGSDSLLTDSDYEIVPDLQMFPFLTGGIVPMARNFENMALTREILAEIFSGNIEYWDDERITALNPEISFPHYQILVIYHENQSGMTEEFTGALSKFSEDWKQRFGQSEVWPAELVANTDRFIPTSGNSEAFIMSVLTPFSISYVSFSSIQHAQFENFGISLWNKAGKLVSCSLHSIEEARMNVELTDRFTGDLSDSDREDAWPLAGYTYIILRTESTKVEFCEEFWHAIDFLSYGITNHIPQILVKLNGFVPVDDMIHEETLSIFDKVTCNGEARFNSNRSPLVAPIPPEFYYETLDDISSYSPFSTVSYSPFFNSLGSPISRSEADKFEPSTISSLFSSNIAYRNYYSTDSSNESKANSIHCGQILMLLCLLLPLELYIL